MAGEYQDKVEDPGGSSTFPPNKVDLSAMAEDDVFSGSTSKPTVLEPSLPIIGYKLSQFVLWTIIGCLAMLFLFLFFKPLDATSDFDTSQLNPADSLFAKKLEVFKLVKEEKNDVRAFFISIAQLILLNLLLPVLTAILGYIFGANNKPKEE
ncbi:hypothetical protein J0A67_14390 [Algoriphagus aestuariicola]|uniref:Transmembrane protein n=1 Tax=Algoriphagus aestuariicola TaxID=1852016 RepID=A0ABS3BS02_9BACT|nr:hypothetical protein [Algoriphagus aestuariicola]MBN7802059.1 hypothetical protein [Algoriphagus aestuariicola]